MKRTEYKPSPIFRKNDRVEDIDTGRFGTIFKVITSLRYYIDFGNGDRRIRRASRLRPVRP